MTVRWRAATLWLVATAGLAALGALGFAPARDLVLAPAADFTGLLEQACSAAALGAAGLLWVLTSHVAFVVVRRPLERAVRRVGPVRTLLLAACGVAALGSTTTATATPDAPAAPPLPARVLAGLPLPDRATAQAQPATATAGARGTAEAQAGDVVRVQPGDSLWRIAARRLGPAASAADVASCWREVHRLNAATIGPDPDVLNPGQLLRLPQLPPTG